MSVSRLFRALCLGTSLFALVNLLALDWVSTARQGDILSFFVGSPAQIQRYNVATRTWLTPVMLPTARGTLTAGNVDADGYYVAYERAVYRYSDSGGNEIPILNTTDPVQELFTDGNLLLISHSVSLYARWVSVNKTNNTIIAATEHYVDSTFGCSIARNANRIVGTTRGISPADVVYLDYTNEGTFDTTNDSPAHGDYAIGTRTWLFPDEARFTDTTGHVYNTADLTHVLSFGTAIDDLAFFGSNIPIVLRGSTLSSYSNALLPAGSATLAAPAKAIVVSGDSVVAFRPTADSSIGTEIVALSTLRAPEPGQPVDPRGVAYVPDAVFQDNAGIVHLFSKAHLTIFRWDPATQDYLTGIPLIGGPSFAAYSSAENCIYTAYPSGLVRKISLADETHAELPFVQLSAAPLGIAAAGPFFFACDGSGAWASHYTYSVNGQLVAAKDWNYYSRAYLWSDVNQKMYFFRDDTSPNDLLWEEINANGSTYPSLAAGAIGNIKDSPLHTSTGFTHPIRPSPNGDYVVLGSGVVHDGRTLDRLSTALANEFIDGNWIGTKFFSIRTISNAAQIQEWSPPNFSAGLVRQIPGTARHLITLPGGKMVVILYGSSQAPAFYVLDQQLNVVAPTVLQTPTGLTASVLSATHIQLTWNAVPGGESYLLERRTLPDLTWTTVGTTSIGVTFFSDITVGVGGSYAYRVTAKSGTTLSSPSNPVTTGIAAPAQPVLAATLETNSAVRLTWPAADRASTYVLSRQQSPSTTWTTLSNTLSAATLTYLDSNLSAGTTYNYRLVASNIVGSSNPSATVSVTTPLTPPDTPYLYSYYAQNALTIYVSWSSPARSSSYRLERSSSSSGPWQTVVTRAAPDTYYTDQTVSPETAYYYRVIAINAAGESPPSNPILVTTPALVIPSAPSNFSARAVGATAVALSWTDSALEFSYRVERRIGEQAWLIVATLPADTTNYTDTTVTNGTYYNYRIVAQNTAGIAESTIVYLRAANTGNLLAEDFDPAQDSVWSAIRGGTVRSGSVGFLQGNALWMGGDGTRAAELLPMDVSQGGTLSFSFRAGNTATDGAELWEDSDAGESVALQYSVNGTTWTTLSTLTTLAPAYSTWSVQNIAIPIAARTSSTRFRWLQSTHSGAGCDVWALDDIAIIGALPDLPDAPGFIFGLANSSRAIALSWSPASRAAYYVIQRRTSASAWQDIGISGYAQTYYTDLAAEPATLYSYRVVARNASGDSPPSSYTIASTWSTLAEWRFQNYGTINNEGIAASLQDNGTGLPNLLRYAFNMTGDEVYYQVNVSGDVKGLPNVQFSSASGKLQVAFIRRRAIRNPGITYSVEFSDDMSSWTAGGAEILAVTIDLDFEFVIWEDSVRLGSSSSSRFARVRVSD